MSINDKVFKSLVDAASCPTDLDDHLSSSESTRGFDFILLPQRDLAFVLLDL